MEVSTTLSTQMKRDGTPKEVDKVAMKKGRKRRKRGSIGVMNLAKGADIVAKNLAEEVGSAVTSLAKEVSIPVRNIAKDIG